MVLLFKNNCILTSKGISITCDFSSKINPKGNTAVYVKYGIRRWYPALNKLVDSINGPDDLSVHPDGGPYLFLYPANKFELYP